MDTRQKLHRSLLFAAWTCWTSYCSITDKCFMTLFTMSLVHCLQLWCVASAVILLFVSVEDNHLVVNV